MGDLERRPIGEHDWHSADYVRQWIERDVTRDSERLPLLRQMLTIAPFARDAQIKALDVGAGYGLLSQQVLELFPQAHVTLQDYSAPMFEYAHQRLAKYRTRISFARGDLRNPEWDRELECPFDLIVSGLAIHNLRAPSLMQSCYGAIKALLHTSGVFLDYDLFGLVDGGTATHIKWLREAGFARVECTWEQPPLGIVAASVDPDKTARV
jgi:SAM-dependent methyltransferase